MSGQSRLQIEMRSGIASGEGIWEARIGDSPVQYWSRHGPVTITVFPEGSVTVSDSWSPPQPDPDFWRGLAGGLGIIVACLLVVGLLR